MIIYISIKGLAFYKLTSFQMSLFLISLRRVMLLLDDLLSLSP